MLSRKRIQYVRSLEAKKYRKLHRAFVAEGNKLVADLMGAFECEWMLAKPSWMATRGDIPAGELCVDLGDEIRKVSFLATPQDVIAVFKCPSYDLGCADASSNLLLALDGVQDPGNLGTIVRLADWFGVEHIVCSADTADAFAPKAVQASMGALSRVRVHYTSLGSYLGEAFSRSIPLYGAFPGGEDLYGAGLSRSGILVMGNEGNGIRAEIEALIGHRLRIPSYPLGRTTSESLNVAVATAIVCAEFRRRFISDLPPGRTP
ncbi:MAG: RNA methyltransferase [Tannerellaceae bacterium]|jgi:TrmH family RNA methyltransferase|nr:RNA methyltransferase [Tannerellaceae bacterium]